jgi:hypothetical protein
MKHNTCKITFILSVILLILAFAAFVSAATVIVPVANTNDASNRKPFGVFFGFERSAAIYQGSELGFVGGESVSQACWFVNANSSAANTPAVIYMKNTANPDFALTTTVVAEEAGATQVFNATIPAATFVAGGFACVNLPTPFINAGPNLEVLVETNFGGGGNGGSTSRTIRGSITALATHQIWDADTTPPSGVGSLTAVPTRPNIRLTFTAATGPGTLQFSSPTYNKTEAAANATITVNRVAGQTGAVSVNYATANGTATGGASCVVGVDFVNASGTLSWANGDIAAKTFTVPICFDGIIEPSETVNLTLSNPVGTTVSGTNPAVLNIADTNGFSGSYNVGTGQTFTSLTNPGGIFEAINNGALTANVIINITSDLVSESGFVGLNQWAEVGAGNYTLLVKPSGAPRTVTGANASGGIINLFDADRVTIDGSTAAVVGGTTAFRQMTITNTDPSTTAGVIVVAGVINGAKNNAIRNLNLIGNSPTTTAAGITLGGSTIGSAGLDNDNNTVQNCSVQNAIYGIYSTGASSANPNLGTIIRENDLSAVGATRIGRVGILVFNESGALITQNSIGGIDSTETEDAIGIGVGTQFVDATNVTDGGVINSVISRNKINGVTQSNTFSAVGIAVAGGTGGANTIANNMITGVIGDGTTGDFPAGICVIGAVSSNTRLYYNSVAMTGDRSLLTTPASTQDPSFAIAITGVNPNVTMRNNIFYTSQTSNSAVSPGAKSYAIGMASTAFTNFDSNNNAYFSTGLNDGGFRSGSLALPAVPTDYALIANWQGAVLKDALSVEGNPLFVNPLSNLHIAATTILLVDSAVDIPAVPDDFDGQIRSVVGFVAGIPDIGADEATLVPTAANASIHGRLITPFGRGLLNAYVILTNTNTGEVRTARSTTFGYFNFQDLQTGDFYVISVNSKRYEFINQSFTLDENIDDLVLTAQP